jgi:hypothetical protein
MMSSSLSAFLGEIGRHQLLTPEQELMLGRKVQAMVAITEPCLIAGGSGPSCEYNDNQRFVIRRGEKAKNQMITANLRLVVNLAKRYQGKGLDLLDLIQEGTLGLTRAVEKYDPDQRPSFFDLCLLVDSARAQSRPIHAKPNDPNPRQCERKIDEAQGSEGTRHATQWTNRDWGTVSRIHEYSPN